MKKLFFVLSLIFGLNSGASEINDFDEVITMSPGATSVCISGEKAGCMYATATTIIPFVSSIESLAENKEIMFAAKDSAVMYIASNGDIAADALLQDALSVIGDHPETANLSELEKAKLIVILTEESAVR